MFDWFDQAKSGSVPGDDPWRADANHQVAQVAARRRGHAGSPAAARPNLNVGAGIVHRQFADFYAERTDLSTGQVSDEFGQESDRTLVENTNAVSRRYNALIVRFDGHAGSRVTFGGNYTLSELRGNIDGETVGVGPVANGVLSYPEFSDSSWSRPQGDLSADQRHRVRFWGTLVMPISSADVVSVSVFEQAESGTPYGAAAAISLWDLEGNPYVNNPGYLIPPDTATYYFTARDAFRTAAMYRTDLAVNYRRQLSSRHGTEFFAQAPTIERVQPVSDLQQHVEPDQHNGVDRDR